MNYAIVVGLLPRTEGRVGNGIAHGVVAAHKMVGRIEKIILALVLDDRWTFHDRCRRIIGRVLPCLRVVKTALEGVTVYGLGVLIVCGYPDEVAIIEPHMEEIRLAVVIGKDKGVYVLGRLIDRLDLLLGVWSRELWRLSHRHLLVGSIGQLPCLAVFVKLWSPEPLVAIHLLALCEEPSHGSPCLQVLRFEHRKALRSFAGRTCEIEG